MFQKLIAHVNNPWAWFFSLVITGVALSIGASTLGQPAFSPPFSASAGGSCIPLMERAAGGVGFTGRISCMSEGQVQQLCTEVLESRGKDASTGE